MLLNLVGVYQDISERRYIITAFTVLEQEYNNLQFQEVDTDNNFVTHSGSPFPLEVPVMEPLGFDFIGRYQVEAFPSLILFKSGQPVGRLVGKHETTHVKEWITRFPWIHS